MKDILVTGVSKGLGLEISRLLLEKDYNVFGICRENTNELSVMIDKYKNRLNVFNYDLHNSRDIKETLNDTFIGLKTPIHGFVNNAAYAYDDIISNLDLGELEKMFKINVFSPMLLTKLVIRNMLFHKASGSIVHISSISAHTGYKGLAMYASTKGAIEAFSKNTSREWGSKGIRSNCVVAGFMETGMSASLSDSQKDKIYKRTSLKRETSIASVSKTVEFLLSDNSYSITGQNIFVDSGTI